MGRKSSTPNKSKRNKRSKAAKLRWSNGKQRSNLPMIYDEIPHIETDFEQFREGSCEQSVSHHFEDLVAVEGHDISENRMVESDEMEISTYIERIPNWATKKYETHHTINENEFGVLSSDECDRIENYPLCIETTSSEPSPITGNRIVQLGYVLDTILKLQSDHYEKCTQGRLFVKHERRRGMGLISIITLQCVQCSKMFEFQTENPDSPVSPINTGAVYGVMATGSTFSHMEEFLSCMDIPSMGEKMFYALENELGTEWKLSLLHSMESAGAKEKEFAISNNQISEDGTPWIKVYVDGSWSKRSYGTNFNSLSGMVAIVGSYTGQVLFTSVRNKFCSICVRAENKSEQPKEHACYKNWTSSASAMEADMVVEGFNASIDMHGVKYGRFVGDGDSSVFVQIKQKVSYGHEVKKFECTNHALKNYGKHIRKVQKDTHISVNGRKLLTGKKINLLAKRAKCSIYEHAKGNHNLSLLREDLENGLHHVFGDHLKCREGICNNVGEQNDSQIAELRATTMYFHLTVFVGALNLLIRKAHLLIENENNNRSERLMNIVSRFNMGKRLNLVQRGSYERRVHLSALRYNKSSSWYGSPWKSFLKKSPGQHFKKFVTKCQSVQANKVRRKLISDENLQQKSNVKKQKTKNTDYGPLAEQPEEDPEILLAECNRVLEKLQVTTEERNQIEELSRGQFGNEYYECERKLRLTASLFGNVVKRKQHTPCHNLVKSCLVTSHFYSEACEYGIAHENVAIAIFEKKTGLHVEKSGLWVDLDYGFLGASPDGLTSDGGSVEVKCVVVEPVTEPISDIGDVIELKKKLKKPFCMEKKDGVIRLKRNHNYYLQVQGQLNVIKKDKCYFILYVNDNVDLFIEEIYRDTELWHSEMLPKLTQFYKECIAPEIIRNNLRKGLKCVDPIYIKEAKRIYEEKKSKKQTNAAAT